MRLPLACACSLLLAFACALAVAAPARADGVQAAFEAGELTEAEHTLARAQSLFDLRGLRQRFGSVEKPDAHAPTMLLRDLRAALPRLADGDRAKALALLARPGAAEGAGDPFGNSYDEHSPRVDCGPKVCVHWTESGPDAVPFADADGDGVADWVAATKRTFQEVWAAEVDRLGYRPPLDDSEAAMNGGDGRFDVYLADIGDNGYFGYCTTDDPNADRSASVSAYCVVENDFSEAAFGGMAPLRALRATAAHEFFHAIQFGYDWLEDTWLLEGTAAWVEDEVYDAVDDNRRFLAAASPLAQPGVPLDHGDRGYEYGNWIFWRYLSERHGTSLVRDVWERAAPQAHGDGYSLTAVSGALAARGVELRTAFASFGAANRIPGVAYDEGRAYWGASPWRRHVVSPASKVHDGQTSLAHLTTRSVSFHPGAGVGRSARLRLSVTAPPGSAPAAARAVVVRASGSARIVRVPLQRAISLPFGRDRIRRIDLVLANAGTGYACWRGTALSCRGVALDDGLVFGYQASLG